MFKHSHGLSDKILLIIIGLLVIAALIVGAIFVVSVNHSHDNSLVVKDVKSEDTPSPLVIDSGSQPTLEPEVAPVETILPAATSQPYDYLPTFNGASTTDHVIAITLDDLSNYSGFYDAVQAAVRYKVKLTLFPHGYALANDSVAALLRYCVTDLGFEVENRTMNNQLLYQLEDSLMAQEIWLAQETIENALGGDYSMHFLRTRSSLGTTDPRTNDYLKKLGYDGFIGWNVNGNGTSLESLYSSLKPGCIYYFSTQTADVTNMIQLMRYAYSRGYSMVTVNELLGYPDNELSETRSADTMPEPDAYQLYDLTFQQGSRAWQVCLIQRRLIELGYLAGNADGIFGETTVNAILLFQADAGFLCTGIASLETQALLFSDDAPVSTRATPVPQVTDDPDIPFLPANTGPVDNGTRPPIPTTAPTATLPPATQSSEAGSVAVETPAPVALPTDAGPATPDPLDVALGRATPLPDSGSDRTPSPAALSTGVPLPEATQAPVSLPEATQQPQSSQPTADFSTTRPNSDIPLLTVAP